MDRHDRPAFHDCRRCWIPKFNQNVEEGRQYLFCQNDKKWYHERFWAGERGSELYVSSESDLTNLRRNYTKEHNVVWVFSIQAIKGKISFSLDCWTSLRNHAFLGITAHYIDNDWRLQSRLVDFSDISGPHTGENLCASFVKSVKEIGLLRKVLYIYHLSKEKLPTTKCYSYNN